MTVKYEVPNQLTGTPIEADSWEEAKILQQQVRQEYMDHIAGCFTITVKIQNEDGSWTYAAADENGEPIINDETL
jgi:hypothetical protein